MGLFSSKTKTSVASVVYPLMGNGGEADTPDYLKQTVIAASYNGWDITNRVNYYLANGRYFDIKRMFLYTKKSYPFGLTNCSYMVTSSDPSDLPDSTGTRFGVNIMPSLILRYGGRDFLDPNSSGTYNWLGNAVKTGNTELYKSTKQILKMLGADADELRGQINDNKNINDIDHAFMVTAVDLATETKWGKRYLYEYFNRLANIQTLSETKFYQDTGPNFSSLMSLPIEVTKAPSSIRQNNIRYRDQDPFQESYDFTLQWNYINKYVTNGNIGPVGTVDRQIGANTQVLNITNDMVLFRKQISPTQLECLEVRGLLHRNNVYKEHYVEIDAIKAITDREETQGFLIPIDMDILDSLPMNVRHQLAGEINWMVFNCVDQKKQKWYQRGAFGKLLMIAGFVLAMLFPPAIVLAQASITMSIVVAVGITLGIQLLLSMIPKVAASIGKLFGMSEEALAKFVAAVTIIATLVVMMKSFKIAQAGGATPPTSMNWMQMTNAVLNSTTAGINQYTQMGFENLAKQQAEADKKFKEEQKKIDDLWDYLTPNTSFSFNTVQSQIASTTLALTDTPEIFLRRTLLTAQDVVDLTYLDIEMFVSTNIRLPYITPPNIHTGVSIERS